jgi:hypothetical protein
VFLHPPKALDRRRKGTGDAHAQGQRKLMYQRFETLIESM